jgi:ubiquinol-cytochrome c reductase iron-sulfur subunit
LQTRPDRYLTGGLAVTFPAGIHTQGAMATEANIPHDAPSPAKRRFLLAATGVVGGIGAVAAVAPFLFSLQPSERAKAAGAPVEVDISKLEPGQKIDVEWRGKVCWVINRTPEMLASLPKLDGAVADPNSEVDHQPANC